MKAILYWVIGLTMICGCKTANGSRKLSGPKELTISETEIMRKDYAFAVCMHASYKKFEYEESSGDPTIAIIADLLAGQLSVLKRIENYTVAQVDTVYKDWGRNGQTYYDEPSIIMNCLKIYRSKELKKQVRKAGEQKDNTIG